MGCYALIRCVPEHGFSAGAGSGPECERICGKNHLSNGGAIVTRSDAMTKAELVEEVGGMTQLTKKHAEIIVNTVFESIVESLRDGSKIELRGFGSFRVRNRGARIGRNPKTGDQVDVPAKRIPYFKPGKQLKVLLNS